MDKPLEEFPFTSLRGGDRVAFRAYAGMGRYGPEYRERVGTVNPLLIFPDHVVLNCGGPHGTPAVVNASNFVRVVSVKKGAAR